MLSEDEYKVSAQNINIIFAKDTDEWRIMFELVSEEGNEIFFSETFDENISEVELLDFIQLVIKLAQKKLIRVNQPINGLEMLLQKINK